MDEDISKRITALEAELAELKAQVKPVEHVPKSRTPIGPRIDYTEGMRLPASAARAMANVVPDLKDRGGFNAHAHAQTKVGEPGGFGEPSKSTGGVEVERGSGWVKPQDMSASPSTRRYVDQQIDAQDIRDRRDLERRLGGGK